MANHEGLTGNKLHTPFRWIFDNEAARTSESVSDDDLSKLALQRSDGSLWALVSTDPVWMQVGGSSPVLTTRGDLLTVDEDGKIKRLPRGSEGQILSWDANGDTLVTSLSGVPVGTVAHHAGTTAPSGWLIRNGATVFRSSYADLFAVIGTTFGAGNGSTTFKLPDDRNLFDRGVPGGGTVGTYQADEFKSHSHQLNLTPYYATNYGSRQATGRSDYTYSFHPLTSSSGGSETRPKNRHYLPIIKY